MFNTRILFFLLIPFFLTSCQDEGEGLQGNWAERPGGFSGKARYSAVSFTIGNKAYVGLGYDGRNKLKTFYEYDPQADAWTQKADFAGTPRTGAVGFSIGSMGYIGTGYDEDDYRNDFYAYDPEANKWTRKADFGGTPRRNALGFGIGSKGYLGTGYDLTDGASSYRGDIWEFDPADASNGLDTDGNPLGKWISKTDYAGKKRYGAGVFIIDNKAYIGGGNSNGTYPDDFYEYDPAQNKWTKKADLDNLGRVEAVFFAINGKGYVTMGSNSGSLRDCYEYNPASNTWTEKRPFEGAARSGAVGFSIGNFGYVGTGSGPFDDFWRFDPNAAYVDPDDDVWP